MNYCEWDIYTTSLFMIITSHNRDRGRFYFSSSSSLNSAYRERRRSLLSLVDFFIYLYWCDGDIKGCVLFSANLNHEIRAISVFQTSSRIVLRVRFRGTLNQISKRVCVCVWICCRFVLWEGKLERGHQVVGDNTLGTTQ